MIYTEEVLISRKRTLGMGVELVHGVVVPIPDLLPFYAVDAAGNVYKQIGIWTTDGDTVRLLEALKIQRSHNGYAQVKLSTGRGRRRWFKIGATVLRLFIGEPPSPKHHCAHLDGNQTNNHLTNLAWKLQPENEADKKRHGTAVGARPGHRKLTLRKKLSILRWYASTGMGAESFTQGARKLRVHRSTIARVVDHKVSLACGGLLHCPLCRFIHQERGGEDLRLDSR